MNKKLCLLISSYLFLSTEPVQAKQFNYDNWTFNAGANATLLYGYNDFSNRFDLENENDNVYSSLYLTFSAAYNFNKDYQLGVYYLPNTSGTQYLENYSGDEWTNQIYGAFMSPYGQFQVGMNYNVAYQMYVGAPVVGPLGVNDSAITDFLNNPNWSKDGKYAFYPTLDSTKLDTDNIAPKFSYLSPVYKGTQFGFSYMPSAYNRSGLLNGYAPYYDKEAYVAALSNEHQFGVFNVSSYVGYGLYVDDHEDMSVGASVTYKNWTLGGSYRQTNADSNNPINQQINDNVTPEFYDGFRDGRVWNIGLSYTYENFSTGVSYFESIARKSRNRDQFVQWANQYQVDEYWTLYTALGYVRFEGLTGTAADSNEGCSFIAGVGFNI